VDLVGGEKDVDVLLKSAIHFAIENKADFIDFFSFPMMYQRALQNSGFSVYNSNTNKEPPIFILPVDRTKLSLNFSYKFVNRENKVPPEDWFVVKSDGDRDRAY